MIIRWLLNQFRSAPHSIVDLDAPWDEGQSLYSFVEQHIDSETGELAEAAEQLPDDPHDGDDNIRWAPGALDGASGHHAALEESADLESTVDCAIDLATEPNSEKFAQFYEKLLSLNAINDIDTFLEQVVERTGEPPPHLHDLGLRLATEAPDREPVKFGIGLLGLVPEPDDASVFLILGRHDEFSLYSVVAILNSFERGEYIVWDLAKHLDGWGRIHAVEFLAETSDPDIKRWLLREGFRNSIMNEYLGLICAEAGELADALDANEVDRELLLSAADILDALLTSFTPSGTIEDYPDAARVVEDFLAHLRDAPSDVRFLNPLIGLHQYLADADHPLDHPPSCGWDAQTVESLAAKAESLLAEERWTDAVQQALHSEDRYEFSLAAKAAPTLGIDPWPHQFRRLTNGEDLWYSVMQTEKSDRIDKVLAYAEETLDLDAIATGPADKLTADANRDQHSANKFIIQGLRRFPGRGWKFVKTGLQSPVIGDRNMALRVLDAWDESDWPDDARTSLESAEEREPQDDVRVRITDLLEYGEIQEEDSP